ncbi:Putative Mce family protein [Mycobacteroides abscessus subsp. abscessus]|nr:Putative Mce family protein [Mycobacteroides abscessus subsp. abscessus]
MITDFNTIARAFNDVTVSPDTSLVALNRLLPILIKANAGSALAVDVNMAKLALGNWPDAGYKGDPTFHGPKQADWGYRHPSRNRNPRRRPSQGRADDRPGAVRWSAGIGVPGTAGHW